MLMTEGSLLLLTYSLVTLLLCMLQCGKGRYSPVTGAQTECLESECPGGQGNGSKGKASKAAGCADCVAGTASAGGAAQYLAPARSPRRA